MDLKVWNECLRFILFAFEFKNLPDQYSEIEKYYNNLKIFFKKKSFPMAFF